MLRFLCFFALFVGSPVVMAVEVLDPHNSLSWLQRYTKPVPFEEAFQCTANSHMTYKSPITNCHNKCNESYCQIDCFGDEEGIERKSTLYVENCTADSVSIYGDNGLSMEVTREDYVKGGHTLLIPLLKSAGHFIQPEGDIELGMVMQTFVPYRQTNGQMLHAISVSLQIITPGTAHKATYNVILSPAKKGLAQLLMFGDFGDEFLLSEDLLEGF